MTPETAREIASQLGQIKGLLVLSGGSLVGIWVTLMLGGR